MARNYEHSNDETNNETIELRIRAVEPCRGNDPDAVMMRISASASSRSKPSGGSIAFCSSSSRTMVGTSPHRRISIAEASTTGLRLRLKQDD